MTVFEKVLNTLECLNLPIVRSHYKGEAPSYIIFSTIAEKDHCITDNEAEGESYKFKLNYWLDGNEQDLSRQIIKRMKQAGFHRNYCMDTFDDNFYGYVMEFEGVLWNHELEEDV